MKKTYIIIAAVVTVLILLAVWVYLLFTPKSPEEIWTGFGFGGEEDPTIVIPVEPTPVEEPVINMARPKLRQLTTKPVVGFVEVQGSTSTAPVLYYAEAGTGHLYTINIETGAETRISNTTVQNASQAVFSPRGTQVAMKTSNDRRASQVKWGSLGTSTESVSYNTLEEDVYELSLVSESELLYSVRGTAGSIGKGYNVRTGTSSELFTVPFYETAVLWGTSSKAAHYIFPKPAYALEGYVYKVQASKSSRIGVVGFGLTALKTPNQIMYTKVREYVPETVFYNPTTNTHTASPFVLLPEKCAASLLTADIVWCGADIRADLPMTFPDSWYKGELNFTDTIWVIDPNTGIAEPLVDTRKESGRDIDIMSMVVGTYEQALYFINKNDNTLWMYEF